MRVGPEDRAVDKARLRRPALERGGEIEMRWIRIVVVVGMVLCSRQAHGMRLYWASVELDGRRILEADCGDDGLPSPYLVWRSLSTIPLRPCVGFDGYVVHPERDQATVAILRGDIVVRLEYGATESTRELRLRAHPEGWVIDPEWVRNHGPEGDLDVETRKLEELRRHDHWEETKLPLAVVLAGCALLLAMLCLGRLWWPTVPNWLLPCTLLVLILCIASAGLAWKTPSWASRNAVVQVYWADAAALGFVMAVWLINPCIRASGRCVRRRSRRTQPTDDR